MRGQSEEGIMNIAVHICCKNKKSEHFIHQPLVRMSALGLYFLFCKARDLAARFEQK